MSGNLSANVRIFIWTVGVVTNLFVAWNVVPLAAGFNIWGALSTVCAFGVMILSMVGHIIDAVSERKP